ncbi:hypothetical protein PB1_16389 [Bacillus methanolicus PB1]|uniref:Uncharacterized protein n=1 Tax=Bacillus methanolicus PB1 TaxID=997296 RepID=I3DY32_BACMT|nr:hypothetical protein [Bacillus methanolicus]EIJ79153.1 hypothetical protein PB1_16389 [Bacillus methanolicus PB1]
MNDQERLEKLKSTDLGPIAFYLNHKTVFDGTRLKKDWDWLIQTVKELQAENEALKSSLEFQTILKESYDKLHGQELREKFKFAKQLQQAQERIAFLEALLKAR